VVTEPQIFAIGIFILAGAPAPKVLHSLYATLNRSLMDVNIVLLLTSQLLDGIERFFVESDEIIGRHHENVELIGKQQRYAN
jgi:hypothetical protein